MKNPRSKFWNIMVDILDGQFEKGKCKERGKALVMLTYIEMMLNGYKFDKDGRPDGRKKEKFESLKEPLDKIEWILLILIGIVAGFWIGTILAVEYLIC